MTVAVTAEESQPREGKTVEILRGPFLAASLLAFMSKQLRPGVHTRRPVSQLRGPSWLLHTALGVTHEFRQPTCAGNQV